MSYKKFDAIREELRRSQDYQREKARIDFAVALWQLMERNGVSRAKLAGSLGKSAPWVTKVLSGDSNFTINTMVELANAVGGELCLHIADARSQARWIESIPNLALPAPRPWGELTKNAGVKITQEAEGAQESLAA